MAHDDDDDMDPFKTLLPAAESKLQRPNISDQRHFIPSLNSTVVIRQLPSQGLSFQLWPAATTLFTLLNSHRSNPTTSPLAPVISPFSSSNKLRILELGSGTGLVGIAAAVTLGANVTVTDLPHVMANLEFNVVANANAIAMGGGTVNAAALRWGEEGDGDVEAVGNDYDVIMASDVVYYDSLYEPLLYTVGMVMGGEKKKKKKFVMGHLRRWKKDSAFFKKAKKLYEVEVIYVDSPAEGCRTGVVVYCFSHKGQKLFP